MKLVRFICKCFSLILKCLQVFLLFSGGLFWLGAIAIFIADGLEDVSTIIILFISGPISVLIGKGCGLLGDKFEGMSYDSSYRSRTPYSAPRFRLHADTYCPQRDSRLTGGTTYISSQVGTCSASSSFDSSEYVKEHCGGYIYGVVADADISRIEQDQSLTCAQKEAAVEELKHKAALYY